MIEYIMMGAQAAGMIGDIWANSKSSGIAKRGQQLEEQQLDLRLEQERVASQEQTLASLDMLAETLATQRAMMAVRGGSPGAGSNLAISQKAIATTAKDEVARDLSMGFLAQQRKAQMSVGKLAGFGKQAKAGAEMFSRGFNQLPLAQAAASFGGMLGGTTNKGGY